MSWQLYVKSAESILESKRIPPCQEIISFIKRINPTSLQLSETDRERGYLIKNRLQNLLLENYGETFHLVSHPYNPDIILIKHNALPSVDACHADLNALSLTALDRVGEPAKTTPGTPRREAKAKPRQEATGPTAKEILNDAELLLAQYDYPQAEEMLASLRITDARELPTLLKAARLLVEEMGAYGRAIEVLLAQPRQVLKDKAVRELLALTYHGNGMIPEARALFDASHPGELGKGALYAYADISFKDGNLSQAYHLLRLSEEKEGFVTAHASLRMEIEAALLEEARPFLDEAEAALARGDEARAESLLSQALSLYPGFQRARQLTSEIVARKTGAELEMLWERFESSATAEERLDLLAQLLERDKESEKIRKLMTRERWRQKQDALEDRLRDLQTLAAEEKWEECFDAVLWLSRQGGEAYYRRACEVSPYFSVLHQNKRLQRLPDEEAKGVWLAFVSLKSLVRQGQLEGCFNLAQDLKPYFRSDPLFREDYDRILELEREKARQALVPLCERLVGLQQGEELEDLEEPERSEKMRENFAEAKQIFADMRRWLVLLPADERAESQKAAERILDRLDPDADDGSYEDYRDALLLGHSVRAGRIREAYCHSWVKGWFDKIDAEIAEMFAISAEPIPLTVSPDLVVDLGTESVPPGPKYLTSSERHLVYEEDDETLIVIDAWRMSAARYRSPHFKDLEISDIDPETDLFLFVNTATNNTVWRATLSETESRFTAVFNINEHFMYQEGAWFDGMYLCCGKENAYYAFIREGDALRVVKQNIDLVSSVVRTYEVKGEIADSFRLSFRPDRFVICTESSTIVLESNLTPTRDCSRAGSGQKLYPLGVDTRRSQIFAVGDDRVNVLNSRLRAVKQLKRRETLGHVLLQSLARICVDNLTLVLSLDQTSTFYNMETDQFSQKFLHHRLMNTKTPSRWYYGEFDMTKPAVRIRDITDELTTLLKWEVMCHEVPGDDTGEIAGEELRRKLDDPSYFSIIRPADRPGDDAVPGVEDSGGWGTDNP